jgi:1,2-phenylacetyl-CoA epoxidase PaaB subunit
MGNTSDTAETTTSGTRTRSRREALNENRVWQVYARRKYEEPLYEIGNVMADDPELAKVYARSIYDEFTWVEMVLVPRDSIITVIAS